MPSPYPIPKLVLAAIMPAAVMIAVLVSGCSPSTQVDPAPTSATQPASSVVTPTPTESSAPPAPSSTQPSTQGSTQASQPPVTTSAATSAPPPSSAPSVSEPPGPTGSGFDTALAVSLPDSFGPWSKLESRQDGAWTIAVYSQLNAGQLSEVNASRDPGATFEQVVADLIGPNAQQVSTGAVCTSREGIAGCAQQQDGLTVSLTSPNMGEAQVAEALAQLLAALR